MKRSSIIKKALQIFVCAALVMSVGAGSALAKKLGGDKEQAKGDYVWTIDADCTQCHEKQGKSTSDEKLLASKHAALDCTFCHNYEVSAEELAAEVDAEGAAPMTLTEAHAKVDTLEVVKKNSLRNTVVQEEACLMCHNREALIEATADCTVLTDMTQPEPVVVNPHDLVEGSQHDAVTCSSCHVMHSSDPAAAYRACVSCHHAEVWECGTCHTYNANVNA